MTEGPWIGEVTRVQESTGHPYVRVPRLMGPATEYGPVLVVADRVRTTVPGVNGASVVVEGAPVYQVGDQVLVSDVAGRPSVFVVLGRLG
jgi:hypothetical protein